MKKKKKRIWIWIVVAVVVLLVLLPIILGGKPMGYLVDAEAAVADSVVSEVTATGVVQPVYKVTVGTQVSGIVKKLYVDYNDKVKKGDLLAELDKSLLQESLNVQRAQLAVASTVSSNSTASRPPPSRNMTRPRPSWSRCPTSMLPPRPITATRSPT